MNKQERQDFIDYLLGDLFRELDGVSTKNMFGGIGLYLDGSIFGFTGPDGELMFKVDDTNREDYENLGGEQFVYTGHKNKGPVAMPYYTVPAEIIEDPERLADWARTSAGISKNKPR